KILKEGGGVVSIFYHPCEFVHKEFWDGVNFKYGANPPREKWKLPPMKTDAESKTAYQVFEKYVQFIKRFPEVQFITATEAAKLYRDKAIGRKFTPDELKAIAKGVGENVTFQKHGDYALSAADILTLLNECLVEHAAGRKPATLTLKQTPYGPSNKGPVLKEAVTTDWSQFTRTAEDVADFLKKQGRVPTSVWLGSKPVPPEAYLRSLGEVVGALLEGKAAPKEVAVRPAKFAAGNHVAEDSPGLWGWIIFPPGFRAPAMMELARRQAWTLKPAILHAK